jgi:hypothetical protein
MGDAMAFGLASVRAARALLTFAERGIVREGEVDEQLRRAISLADEGIAQLRGTRRAQDAAAGNMTKASALLLLAEHSEGEDAATQRALAIQALAEAVGLLVCSGAMGESEFRSEYDSFGDVLDRIRRRYALVA